MSGERSTLKMGGRGYIPIAQRKAAEEALSEKKEDSQVVSEPVEEKPKKTLKDVMKEAKDHDLDFFLGEGNWQRTSNKYMTFKHVIDDDTIIIQTNNLKVVKKESPVLIINNNQALFLKDWQIRKSSSWEHGIDGYAVKLTRKNFNYIYTHLRVIFKDFILKRPIHLIV